MRTLDAARFQDAEKYASYLKTTAGSLRSELAWENLRAYLPGNGSRARILDLGGGTGSVAVRLAKMDSQVVLLDASEEMLGIAQREAETSGVAARIEFCHADANQLLDLFAAQSFDFVVCHNLLEYVADLGAIIRSLAHVARKDAVVSILVRNRAGEVLKAAIKSLQSWIDREQGHGRVRRHQAAKAGEWLLFRRRNFRRFTRRGCRAI